MNRLNDIIIEMEIRKPYSLPNLKLGDTIFVSYKNLNDKNKKRALNPFLYASNNIPGIIVSFAVDKRIESLFRKMGGLNELQILGYK